MDLGVKEEGSLERIVGKHVYANLYGIDPKILDDEELLRKTVIEAINEAGATLLEIKSWKIPGDKGGVSIIAIVLESHVALHTWTKYRYATLDIYTCGEKADPWKAFNYILKVLKPKYYTVNYADRSSIPIA
ncbi:MAG: adenosylmethionine decarboxylase [Thermoprotei archaeon]|nr:MAG: adenosylmethionine decarboxylase [Thermoprotei archaeon]